MAREKPGRSDIVVSSDRITRAILLIRGQKVMKEFADLRFQSGTSSLRSQIGTSRWGGRRYPPYAFTEQGVAMLSSVLRSKRAINVNIEPRTHGPTGAEGETAHRFRAVGGEMRIEGFAELLHQQTDEAAHLGATIEAHLKESGYGT